MLSEKEFVAAEIDADELSGAASPFVFQKHVAPFSYAPMGMIDPHQAQIYGAVYSGVPVYEMICNNVAVMRRKSDSFMNCTQILKVAGVDKARRTKILEKEILDGVHEKVQGGYGKYQGTWYVSRLFARGVQ